MVLSELENKIRYVQALGKEIKEGAKDKPLDDKVVLHRIAKQCASLAHNLRLHTYAIIED